MKLCSLSELQLTNKCVLVCHLLRCDGAAACAWEMLTGTQDEIGHILEQRLASLSIERLDDFGGVCSTFLYPEKVYAENPPMTKHNAGIFSFTPKNKIALEANEMSKVAKASGYRILILTVQKHGTYGKAWVMASVASRLLASLKYYEDTAEVIDEIKAAVKNDKFMAIHVLAPGFEDVKSLYADKVMTQAEYADDVLLR